MRMKYHLINSMEKDFNKGKNSEDKDKLWSVSDVTLVMSNSEIVKMLMERGTAIKNKNYKLRDKWNKKITKHVHSVDLEKSRNPKQAFVTIEQEDCYNKLLDGEAKIMLFGEWTHLQEATAPTNIIFENRDTTWRHKLNTGFQVFVWISFLLLCSMFIALQI